MRPAELVKISDYIWELPTNFKTGMRVPARIYASEKLVNEMDNGVFEQISNVAMFPGIVNHALCMPDAHWGYGFPIGGVAAIDPEEGVISPGGIGFDINCGMRAVSTNLTLDDITPHLKRLVDQLFLLVPAGVGAHGNLHLSRKQFDEIAVDGALWCLRNGYAWNEDLERTEEFGKIKGADIATVSERAIERGFNQIGTLGSGNHFLEIQIAQPDNIFDSATAKAFGINIPNQVIIMFHCGSRGFGHQIATDYLQLFLNVMGPKYKITMPDRELACAPFNSTEGQRYFSAMKCAVNMSFANRQMILHQIRKAFSEVFGRSPEDLGMHQIYDITHNTAKIETHKVNGKTRHLLIHRKGSTRAFGPHSEGLPDIYKNTGQPIIIGGSMESGSYLLTGVATGNQTFFSTTHGSGRTMSRSKARHVFYGKELQQTMAKRGIVTRTASFSGFAEEAGAAYKNIDDVVDAAEKSGTCRRIVRLVPVGNVKG